MRTIEIKKILIPTDFSDLSKLAIEQGIALSKIYAAEILLIHVVEPLPYSLTSALSNTLTGYDFESRMENLARTKFEALEEELKNEGHTHISTHVSRGKIYEEIARLGQQWEVNMIVMGTHGVYGFREFFTGSATYRVISDSFCPVISIQKRPDHIGFRNILLPLEDRMPEEDKMSFIIDFISKQSAAVKIAGLIDINDEDSKNRTEEILQQVEQLFRENKINFSTTVLEESDLALATLNYAKQMEADLIFNIMDDDYDVAELIGSSFPQQIVNHSSIPVLSLRYVKVPESQPNDSYYEINQYL